MTGFQQVTILFTKDDEECRFCTFCNYYNMFNNKEYCRVCIVLSPTYLSTLNVANEDIWRPGEVDVPKSVTYLNRPPRFEWYVVRYGSKNKYQKNICLKRIILFVHKLITTLGSMINTIEKTYITISMSLRIFVSIMNKIITWAPKVMREVATASIWIC